MPKKKKDYVEQLAEGLRKDLKNSFLEKLEEQNKGKVEQFKEAYNAIVEPYEKKKAEWSKQIIADLATDEDYQNEMKELEEDKGTMEGYQYRNKKNSINDAYLSKNSEYSKWNHQTRKSNDQEVAKLEGDKDNYPYAKMYWLTYDFSEKIEVNKIKPEDFGKAFMSIEEKGISEEDKLICLNFFSETMDKYQIPFFDRSAEREKSDEVRDYAIKYGLAEKVNSKVPITDKQIADYQKDNINIKIEEGKDGEKYQIKDFTRTIYAEHGYNPAIAPMIGSFGKLVNSPKEKIKVDTAKYIRNFCNKTLSEHYAKVITGELTTEGIGVLEANKEIIEKYTNVYNFMQRFDKLEEKSSLSFGREGSEQFKNMKNRYADFKEVLSNCLADPTDENKKTMEETMNDLAGKIDIYLQYKEKQFNDHRIKGEMVDGVFVPRNSNTQKRVAFARNLKDQLGELKILLNKEAEYVKEHKDVEKTKTNAVVLEEEENGLNRSNTISAGREKKHSKNITKDAAKDDLKVDAALKRSNTMHK